MPYHGDNILLDLGRERDQAEEGGKIKLSTGELARTSLQKRKEEKKRKKKREQDRGVPHTELSSSPAEIVSMARVIAII